MSQQRPHFPNFLALPARAESCPPPQPNAAGSPRASQQPFVAPTPNMYSSTPPTRPDGSLLAHVRSYAGQHRSHLAPYGYNPMMQEPLPLQYPVVLQPHHQSHIRNRKFGAVPGFPISQLSPGRSMPPPALPIVSSSSMPPLLRGHKRSRLPSDDAARKVPRRAQRSPSHTPSPTKTASKGIAEARALRTKTCGPEALVRRAQPTRPPSRIDGSTHVTPRIPKAASQQAPKTSQDKRIKSQPQVIEKGDSEVSDDQDDEDYQPRDARNAKPTLGLNRQAPATRIGKARQTVTRAESPDSPVRYQYRVPKQLEGVKMALGEDNWDEYVSLLEHKCAGRISQQDFTGKVRSICQLDVKVKKRMERIMAQEVIEPLLEKRAKMNVAEDGEGDVQEITPAHGRCTTL